MKKLLIALMFAFVAPCYAAGDYSSGVTIWAWAYVCEKRNYITVEESDTLQQWTYQYLVVSQNYTPADRTRLANMVNNRVTQYETYPEQKIKDVCAYMKEEAVGGLK